MYHRRVKDLFWCYMGFEKEKLEQIQSHSKEHFHYPVVEGSLVKQSQTHSIDSEPFIPCVYVVFC